MKLNDRRWTSASFVALFAGLCAATLFAQTDGANLGGTVVDSSGNALQSASLTVKNEATGSVRSLTTEANGHFLVRLPYGFYTVEASAPDFTTTRKTGVQIGTSGVDDLQITLAVANLSQTVTVEAAASIAAEMAPSQASLDAHSAQSVITPQFIDNFTSPVSDYSEMVQMAPGTFSVAPNGIGLGQSKVFFRGFSDGQYTMTFDGIPFEDTNSPTHHTWASFPGQWVGGTLFDRSPGTASTIGPTNFGGSINLLSRDLPADPDITGSVTYGSFNTRLLDASYDSGLFGGKLKKSSLLVDVHDLHSDGYQTYNRQQRDAGMLKYQYRFSDKSTLTLYSGLIDLWTNTPNTTAATRGQIAQFGDNFLLTNDSSSPLYYQYNYYHVQTDFEYIGFKSDLGSGWTFDNKAYTYRYWNKQNYNSATAISATSATDKLNGYRKVGDVMSISQESRFGIFRTGMWYEWAYTDRYQIPSDPRTWADAALPNFHEHFFTNSLQPYGEYEWRATKRLSITGGVKLAYYNFNLDQFADNGKTVGNLGGAAFVNHATSYHSWLPSVDARYRLQSHWSLYAQFATGSVIPPSSVFDVKNALVETVPKPTTTKTYQVGSVWKMNRLTFDIDAYWSRFQNAYTSFTDPASGEPVYTLPGDSKTKGIEAESNIFVGRGLNVYLNGTLGKANYVTSGLWVANAPSDTETIGVTYQLRNWDVGFFNKRIGKMFNDNGVVNQAIGIDPFNITNLYFNYTVKDQSYFRGTKFRLSFNNLFDQHSIVGIVAALPGANPAASPNDQLTKLAARSITLTVTGGWAPRR